MPYNAELAEIALTIARRAAQLAWQRRTEGVEVAASKSSLSDIVTRADREAETADPRRHLGRASGRRLPR